MAGKKWTESEDAILRASHSKTKLEELSKALNRTKRAIIHRLEILGIKKKFAEIGDKFHMLTIIDKFIIYKYGQNITIAKCKCDCGNDYETKLTAIVSGKIKSCGCLKRRLASERATKRNFKHGKGSLDYRLYRIWCAMKSRCRDVSHIQFKDYGGRGIRVCDEWQNDFTSFEQWSLNHGYSDILTIDRIDVNGNYEPNNCRWITHKQQNINKRNNLSEQLLTAFGETKTLTEWINDSRCRLKKPWAILYRISKGASPETAISKVSIRPK